MLTYTKYNEEKLAVRGDRNKYQNFMKTLGGRWNSRMKGGEGWFVPIIQESNLKNFIKELNDEDKKSVDSEDSKHDNTKKEIEEQSVEERDEESSEDEQSVEDVPEERDEESSGEESESSESHKNINPLILRLLKHNNLLNQDNYLSSDDNSDNESLKLDDSGSESEENHENEFTEHRTHDMVTHKVFPENHSPLRRDRKQFPEPKTNKVTNLAFPMTDLQSQELKKEQELKEQELREQESREQELREQESREQELREQESREQELREQESREQELREQESREQELREKELREQELREKELREQELREKELREQELREQELREKELREQELREQELREKEIREQELKEQELREQEELREYELRKQRKEMKKQEKLRKQEEMRKQELLEQERLRKEEEDLRKEELKEQLKLRKQEDNFSYVNPSKKDNIKSHHYYDSDESIDEPIKPETLKHQSKIDKMLAFKKEIMEKQREKEIRRRESKRNDKKKYTRVESNDTIGYYTNFSKNPKKFKSMYVDSGSSSDEMYASSSEHSESSDDFPSPDSPKKYNGHKELLNQIKDLQRKVHELEIKNQKLRADLRNK